MKCRTPNSGTGILPAWWLSRIGALVWTIAMLRSNSCLAAPVVEVELTQESAWMGEGVSFFVTLYSPGPFSGTASFDLPELPRTAIVKQGAPTIGNLTVDGEPMFTQRHEFVLYTQQAGEIVIPSFRVRFAGKKSFLGDPEPIEGDTQQMRFESRRPPGTEPSGIVIAVADMTIAQSWTPGEQRMLNEGDVVQRTITRTANGTTAMMLPDISSAAPAGVRVYESLPQIEDKTERGESSAMRVDTIKYQFERDGTFEIPAIELTWWHAASEQVKTETIAGQTFEVAGNVAEAAPMADWPAERPVSAGMVFIVGFVAWLAFRLGQNLLDKWQSHVNSPEALAAKAVRARCRANDASAVYAAVLNWKRALKYQFDEFATRADIFDTEFESAWNQLAREVYGEAPAKRWNGQGFQAAFDRTRRRLTKRKHRDRASDYVLPQLNPTGNRNSEATAI